MIIQLPPGRLSVHDAWPSCSPRARARSARKSSTCASFTASIAAGGNSTLLGLGGLLHGDFGYSFEYDRPVSDVIGDRVFLTFVDLVHHHPLHLDGVVPDRRLFGDPQVQLRAITCLTFIGFLGLAIPNFLLALVLLYVANVWFGTSIGGLVDAGVSRSADELGEVRLGARSICGCRWW